MSPLREGTSEFNAALDHWLTTDSDDEGVNEEEDTTTPKGEMEDTEDAET